ncbi:hypothetical protein niasHT_021745 [Heterodera trifolii]|uniref:Uncharacterized protein n=1 Tax=Heterodera trifolii TaxID=157864 RepID=A0ABD2KK91_9BILA
MPRGYGMDEVMATTTAGQQNHHPVLLGDRQMGFGGGGTAGGKTAATNASRFRKYRIILLWSVKQKTQHFLAQSAHSLCVQ